MPDFFAEHLDAHPSDIAARLLAADDADERGDVVMARGLRWCAQKGKSPFAYDGGWRWTHDVPRDRRNGWQFESVASAQRALAYALDALAARDAAPAG